jgi:hypothetical protein
VNQKGSIISGKVIKRTGMRIRIETSEAKQTWAEVKEVTAVEGKLPTARGAL